MKICSIVGTRPQFIKHWVLAEELNQRGHQVDLVHTGQHYDADMSKVFFDELDIPDPDYNLGIGSAPHYTQIGEGLIKLGNLFSKCDYDSVIVYGDCNSTLAGALAACKQQIPVCHVEAGLRSGDRMMPEETNRILVDHCSDILCCPTKEACDNLQGEGLKGRYTGDLRVDALQKALELIDEREQTKNKAPYMVATVHREENMNKERFIQIFNQLSDLDEKVIFPIHPRARALYEQYGLKSENVIVINPLGYLNMVRLLTGCSGIYSDSGGLWVESFVLRKPYVSLRTSSEYAAVEKEMFGNGTSRIEIVRTIEKTVNGD